MEDSKSIGLSAKSTQNSSHQNTVSACHGFESLGDPVVVIRHSEQQMKNSECRTIILHQCKHVDRSEKRGQCTSSLQIRPHKRGYLAVSCERGHQWVWCPYCCNCGLGKGCDISAHWMERDSMDTGKRNHMQRHFPSLSAQRKRLKEANGVDPCMEERFSMRRRLFYGPTCNFASSAASPIEIMTAEGLDLHLNNANSVADKAYVGSQQMNGQIELIRNCKNVDRKHNRQPCKGSIRIRNHKRGYLAVVCEFGHQWVWCSYCCDCQRCGIGCSASQHWMERDSFDTGRRNHMQRHLENYDANTDVDGTLLARLDARQVAMPREHLEAAALRAGLFKLPYAQGVQDEFTCNTSEHIGPHTLQAQGHSQRGGDQRSMDEDSVQAHVGTAATNLQQGRQTPGCDGSSLDTHTDSADGVVQAVGSGVAAKGGLSSSGRVHLDDSTAVQSSADVTAQRGAALQQVVRAKAGSDGRPLEDELQSIGVAAVALIALRRSARISGAAEPDQE